MSIGSASELQRLFACPGSAALPTTRAVGSDAAERGTAVHLFLERVAAGMAPEEALDMVEDEEHRALCAAINLAELPIGTAPEVTFAYDLSSGRARELGRRLGRDYRGLAEEELPGTSDAVGVGAAAVFVGDYKTGFHVVAARDNLQLRALCLFAARAYDRDEAIGEIVRIKPDGGVWRDRVTFDALDLDDFSVQLERVTKAVLGQRARAAAGRLPDVVEGDHCRFCPAWDACPAKATALVRVASGADTEPLLSLLPLTPELAGHAWVKMRAARRLLERLEASCHAALNEYGELPLPSGGVLRRVTEPGNERLDGRVVFAVVREQLDQEVAEGAVEGRHEGQRRAGAEGGRGGRQIPPRGRAKAMRQVLDGVRERGGASRPMVQRVVEVHPELPAGEPVPG